MYDLMDVVSRFAALAIVSILVGLIFSLPALIPPLRRLARQNIAARMITMLGLSLLCFIFVYPIILGAATAWATNAFVLNSGMVHPDIAANSSAVSREAWLRLMIPASSLDGPCYNTDEKICGLADQLLVGPFSSTSLERYREEGVQAVVFIVGEFRIISLGSALFCAFFVWLFTRPRHLSAEAGRDTDETNGDDDALVWPPPGLEQRHKPDQIPVRPEQ